MSDDDGLRESVSKMLKHGLSFQLYTKNIIEKYDGDEVEDRIIDVVEDKYNEADKEKKKMMAVLVLNMGNRLGSKKLEMTGRKLIEHWQEEYSE